MLSRRVPLFFVLLVSALGLSAAEPAISVTATPRYPWNGMVDVKFMIEGDAGTKYDTSFTAKDVAGGTNLTMKTLYKSNGAAANPTKESLLQGSYNWVWEAQADLGSDTVLERVTVTAETVASTFTYSVKFNANGGSGTMSNESFTYGTAKALTANAFTRTGYTFQGWATSASGAKSYSDKQSVSNLTTTADGTVNLYAVWKANNYSVKFNANGGSGTMSNESFTYGTAKALTANAFTRTGYTFQGWATSASGAVKYTNKQSVSNLTSTAGGTVNLYAVWSDRLYMVIDLSGGASATSYPVTYLDAVPSGGWSSTYKTTRLVLRYVKPGVFQQLNKRQVTISKAFYIGIFEMTQKQYALLKGSEGLSELGISSSRRGDSRPTIDISFRTITESGGVVSLLKSKTGLNFGLPSEAQWEYACRAGTSSTFSNGGNAESDMKLLGRYKGNCSDGKGGTAVTTVGSYMSNSWGLYDMHGNAWEWCTDWYGTIGTDAVIDPKGASSSDSGARRVMRGGSWAQNASGCSSTSRIGQNYVNALGYEYYCSYDSGGFRLIVVK